MGISSDPKLDLRAILETCLRQFAPWLASVLLVTWAGYPGVVCVTPMAWLIALRVGLLVARKSRSASTDRRIQEAALAGGLFGLLQGILFFIVIGRLEVQADEQTKALALNVFMILAGIFAGAGLSAVNAWLLQSRRRHEIHRTDA